MPELSLSWHTSILVLAALPAALSCGGRTDMLLPGTSGVESSGTGGGTGGTSGSTGGSSTGGSSTGGGATGGIGGAGGSVGGSGGMAGAAGTGGMAGSTACSFVGLNGDPIAFSPNAYSHRARPALSRTGDATFVAVAVAETPVESPVGAAADLRVTGFDAWGSSWPDSLGQGTVAPFVVGVDQYVMDRASDGATVSIAYPASPQPPASYPSGVLYQPSFDVFKGPTEDAMLLLSTSAGYEVARFMETGPAGTLVGTRHTVFADNGPDHHEMFLCAFDSGSGVCRSEACATEPVDADAVAVDDGFLLAYSSSRGFGECMNDDGVVGPPDRIFPSFVGGPNAEAYALPVEVELPDDVVQFVRVLPHSEGAWLVYQYMGLNAEQPPPVMAMRMSRDGTVLLEATPVLDGGQFYGEPAVATIGDQLMVGWVDAFDPSGDTYIMLRLLDDSGFTLSQNAYWRRWASSRISLLGSPDGQHVLVGWSEQTGSDGAGEDQAYVARFSCGYGQM